MTEKDLIFNSLISKMNKLLFIVFFPSQFIHMNHIYVNDFSNLWHELVMTNPSILAYLLKNNSNMVHISVQSHEVLPCQQLS